MDPMSISIRSAAREDTAFIAKIYEENRAVLHGEKIVLAEWEKMLADHDPDEQNFILRFGEEDAAWLKINGLQAKDSPWISMLVVDRRFHRRGIGRFAVRSAERFVRERGFVQLSIQTDRDNLPAQKLYRNCGYFLVEECYCIPQEWENRCIFTKQW